MADEKYLRQYESRLLLKNGAEVLLRPVVPSDAPLLVDMFNKMTPRSRYLRFMSNNLELPEGLLHQFTHLDYHASFAIACLVEANDQTEIIAVARYSHDPDEHIADLGVAVRDDWQNLGIGKSLLSKIIIIGKKMIFGVYGRYRQGLVEEGRDILNYLGEDFLNPEKASALAPHSETYSETQGPETANYLKAVGF